MASKFRVTPRELRNRANELETLNNRFMTEVGQLKDDNTVLGSKWEGDARNKFNEQFLMDVNKFEQFSKGIMGFIRQLRADADNYDKTENTNTSIANVRKS